MNDSAGLDLKFFNNYLISSRDLPQGRQEGI